jgi:hypothetical protein
MPNLMKQLRLFPFEALLIGIIGIGFLSWTSHVDAFRLGIPSTFEHVLAYGGLSLIMALAKGGKPLNWVELTLLIIFAACAEMLKYYIPFRHPKASDFMADIAGLFLSTGFMMGIVLVFKVSLRAAQLLLSSDHWRPYTSSTRTISSSPV